MGRGRDKNLVERRDEKLCARYHYWTEVRRVRFDDALLILSEREFFISEERILRIIRDRYDDFMRGRAPRPPRAPHKVGPAPAAQLTLFTGEQ